MSSSTLKIPVARVFKPLLQPSRYKATYGGRGSAKSHFFAGQMIDDALSQPGLLSVCIREVQKSLKESAYRLIKTKLHDLRLGEKHGFKVYNTVIETPGDGIIIFQGMQDHTAESIKSLEGYNRAWIEEAQTLSHRSLKMLRPTIRAPGSEIWASWNPRKKTDPVDAMFRGEETPTNAIIVRSNWSDNPWFTAELEQERQDCLRMEPEEYDHIWEGAYETVTRGAYYARHLTAARGEGRITDIIPNQLMARRAFCDIGGTGAKADAFTIWVVQFVGMKILCIDYYEAQGQDIGHHLEWLRSRGHTETNTTIFLPHDGSTNDRVYDVSYESEFMNAGYDVEVIPNQGKGAASIRIKEGRKRFAQCWFDKDNCKAGIDALASYQEKIDDVREVGLGPLHNWASHGADAFGLMACCYEEPKSRGGHTTNLKPQTVIA